MRKTGITLLLLLAVLIGHSQWQPTNLTQVNYLPITDISNHNGELMGIVMNTLSDNVYTLNTDNISWTLSTGSGLTEIPTYMQSTGNDLYVYTAGLGYGMMYKSTDNGVSYTATNDGLPEYLLGIAPAYGMKHFNDYVIVNLGSAGYWMKNISENSWSKIELPTELNGGSDPICFTNVYVFAYDNSGTYTFYRSNDFGQSWMSVSSNLPQNFMGNMIVFDHGSGRLYLVGSKADGSEYGIYYSDNNGDSWVMADLSGFIGTDVNGGQQEVTAMYANNNEIFIALENDAANSPPDVLYGASGINSVDYYTAGLANDPAGSIYGHKFVVYNGKIAMALNVQDVYLTDISTDINKEQDLAEFDIFPNPATEFVNFKADFDYSHVVIRDLTGKQVLNSNYNRIMLTDLPKGVYIIELYGINNEILIAKKFIKN
jgi:hypothetical protein